MERFYEAYQNKKLAPFFGAGISMPFYSLDWCGLIKKLAESCREQTKINNLLDEYKYQKALTVIKQESVSALSELDIQNKVCQLYKTRQGELEKLSFSQDNNYSDFFKEGFGHYFTFNYDHFFEGICEMNMQPIHSKVLINEVIDTQYLHKFTRANPVIWHVHGDINTPHSIILSDESYQAAYQNLTYTKQLEYMINNFVFLFVGVSFNDRFIRNFFEQNRDVFKKNSHYILYSEEESINAKDILHDYGLHTIRYDTSKNHITGIREKLLTLFKENKSDELQQIKSNQYTFNIKAKNAPIVNAENATLYFD